MQGSGTVERPSVQWWDAVESGDVAQVQEWLRYYSAQAEERGVLLTKYVNNESRDTSSNALLMAVQAGKEESAMLLLENGANAAQKNSYGATALHVACYKGMASVVAHFINSHQSDPGFLQASLMAADGEGSTCLHEAARKGRKGIVQMLLNCGVDKSVKDRHGKSPADVACDKGVRELLAW